MKNWIGAILMFAGLVAFITPRLNVDMPEELTIPTLPADILGCMLILAGLAKRTYDDCCQ